MISVNSFEAQWFRITIRRAFRMPDDVARDRINAEFSRGRAEGSLPRVAGAEKDIRKIRIKSG